MASSTVFEAEKSDMNRLAANNRKLVFHIANKFVGTGVEKIEIIAVGLVGLVKAARTFDPQKGKFSTYAGRCIRNEILMLLRQRRRDRERCISLEEPLSIDVEGNSFLIKEKLADSEAMSSERVDALTDLRQALRKLPLRDQEILRLIFVEGLTEKRTGLKLGISQSHVNRRKKGALCFLKSEMMR